MNITLRWEQYNSNNNTISLGVWTLSLLLFALSLCNELHSTFVIHIEQVQGAASQLLELQKINLRK